MVTILLEKILSLLEGWAGSFASFIIDLMAKLNLIETETANLPDIKTNTDNISSNTDSMTATLNNIEIDTGVISSKVNSIDSNTTIIKNNINTISTNVGTASAFCEDTANNTLEIVDKITTIASDTTQLRTNSNSISSDVSEIKNTLGLYLYNTIVTEDSEGAVANFDTDLKDYLQEAKVDITYDAGGISGLNIVKCGFNLAKTDILNTNWFLGNLNSDGTISGNNLCCYGSLVRCKPDTKYCICTQEDVLQRRIAWYDKDGNFLSRPNDATQGKVSTFVSPSNAYYMRFSLNCGSGIFSNPLTQPQINTMKICLNESITAIDGTFEAYNGNTQAVTFTTPITDGAEVDLLSGIVKINTTPVTYDSITPLAIRTFKGVNNIYSDIGDMSVIYRETLKHYLEKQNS